MPNQKVKILLKYIYVNRNNFFLSVIIYIQEKVSSMPNKLLFFGQEDTVFFCMPKRLSERYRVCLISKKFTHLLGTGKMKYYICPK